MQFRTLPIFFAFLAMGVADAMGPLSDAVQRDYKLSNVMATLLSFFVFIAFAVFSVPGGLLAARIGKKKLLLLGLALNALAMLIPSVVAPGFALLLSCIFVLGVGTTFLQVAGNPIMRDVSPAGAYSSNLAFAQGIKGLGSTASTWLVSAVASIALFKSMGWRGTFPVFCILMAVTFLLIGILKIDEAKADVPPSIGSCLSLLGEPVFLMAVIGIFLYVGAEVCMARFLNPALTEAGFTDAEVAKYGAATFFMCLTIGRLVGGGVAKVMSPRAFFRLSALLGLIGGGILLTGSRALAIPGVLASGLGFANIWPMLFSITVEEKPERASELSGLMVMAISGGALVPLLMGQLRDMKMGAMSFIVPAACFAYLLAISMRGGHKPAAAPAVAAKA